MGSFSPLPTLATNTPLLRIYPVPLRFPTYRSRVLSLYPPTRFTLPLLHCRRRGKRRREFHRKFYLTEEAHVWCRSGLSTTNKYIIGGSVGGGGLLLILLGLLLLCCRKRRAKRDLERSGECQHGQFTSCNHGTCNTGNVQTPMGQRTPLKPFVLKSDPEAFTIKEVQRQPVVTISLNRRDSTGSQKSAGSDTASNDSDSLSDGDSRRGKKGTHKRPPPLKLTSLVTPVINGPQHNPRDKAHSSLRDPPEIPVIVVDPPQSDTPERIQRL